MLKERHRCCLMSPLCLEHYSPYYVRWSDRHPLLSPVISPPLVSIDFLEGNIAHENNKRVHRTTSRVNVYIQLSGRIFHASCSTRYAIEILCSAIKRSNKRRGNSPYYTHHFCLRSLSTITGHRKSSKNYFHIVFEKQRTIFLRVLRAA